MAPMAGANPKYTINGSRTIFVTFSTDSVPYNLFIFKFNYSYIGNSIFLSFIKYKYIVLLS